MKRNILIFMSLLVATNLFSQYGVLDNNFGSAGILTFNTDSSSEVNSIAVQDDGKIILAGYDYNGYDFDFAVYRLLPDGSPDNSFGTNGKVLTDFSNNDIANSVQIQPDHKILVGGLAAYYTTGPTFALARYNSNGSLDNSFGLNGKILSGTGYGYTHDVTLLLQSEDKVIIVGNNYDPTDNYCDLVRYNSEGAVDHSFTMGKDTLRGYFDCAVLQPDGNILVGGWIKGEISGYDGLVARIKKDGSIDSTFSYDGKVRVDYSFGGEINALTVQNDHKIIAVGSTYVGFGYRSKITRINPNGILDESFGDHGNVVEDTSNYLQEGMNSVLVQPDNKIVAAGHGNNSITGNFKLYRFNENGTLDNTFGTNGVILANNPDNYADCGVYSLALQPDGKILAGGFTTINNNHKMMVMRFTTGLPPVNISENPKNSQISIFPNPFQNDISINVPDIDTHTTANIFTLEGQTIYSTELLSKNQTLNLDFLNPGLYVLRINNTIQNFSRLIVKSH